MPNWFSITMRNQHDDCPSDEATQAGKDVDDEKHFATALGGVIYAMRRMQEAWGNGEDFGGDDPTVMAAHLLLIVTERERGPGCMWNFDTAPGDVAHYAKQLAALAELERAAAAFLSASDPEGEVKPSPCD